MGHITPLLLLLLLVPRLSLSQQPHFATVADSCSAYQRQLAASAANLTECSAQAARPFALCQRCAAAYSSWTALMKELTDYEQCSSYLLQSDSVQTLLRTRDFADSLWQAGGCQYCLAESANGSSAGWSYKPDVAEFLSHVDQLKACFANYTQSRIEPLIGGANADSGNSSIFDAVCHNCLSIYREVNSNFDLLGRDQQRCMDAVDALNASRRAWGEIFQCDPQGRSLQPLPLIIAAYVIVALFYLGARSRGAIKNRRLLRQKRVTVSQTDSLNLQANNL